MSKRLSIIFRVLPDGSWQTANGRDAWALLQLIDKPQGVTPIDTPGPRWSGYVFNLRTMGVTIETIHERHKGAFPGTHARYVLRCQIEIRDGVAPVTNRAALTIDE
jgi:hypothetical protein